MPDTTLRDRVLQKVDPESVVFGKKVGVIVLLFIILFNLLLNIVILFS